MPICFGDCANVKIFATVSKYLDFILVNICNNKYEFISWHNWVDSRICIVFFFVFLNKEKNIFDNVNMIKILGKTGFTAGGFAIFVSTFLLLEVLQTILPLIHKLVSCENVSYQTIGNYSFFFHCQSKIAACSNEKSSECLALLWHANLFLK